MRKIEAQLATDNSLIQILTVQMVQLSGSTAQIMLEFPAK